MGVLRINRWRLRKLAVVDWSVNMNKKTLLICTYNVIRMRLAPHRMLWHIDDEGRNGAYNNKVKLREKENYIVLRTKRENKRIRIKRIKHDICIHISGNEKKGIRRSSLINWLILENLFEQGAETRFCNGCAYDAIDEV